MKSKQALPGHGNENMYMSMDKPMAQHSAEGTGGSQVEKCKNDIKNKSPGNQNIYMSMHKPIALRSTEGTRGPQVKNAKIEVPRPWEIRFCCF